MSTDLPPDVLAAIHISRKIEAIKLLREHQGIGLKEAKEVVDAYMARHPERIQPDPDASGGIGKLILFVVLIAIGYAIYRAVA